MSSDNNKRRTLILGLAGSQSRMSQVPTTWVKPIIENV